jgi:hypothetical protein
VEDEKLKTALARRLVSAKQWRWVVGMETDRGGTVDESTLGDLGTLFDGEWQSLNGQLPDLGSYSTAAILLRMAMEAWRYGPHFAVAESSDDGEDGGWLISQYGRRTGWEDKDLGTVAATALLAVWTGE